jgi:hypothetical protein
MEETKILLAESEIPTHWTNLMPDLPGAPAPPLRPDTLEPAGPDDLSPIFPMGLIQQEVSVEPEIEIPDEVRDIYKLWRPTPLLRARRLERELDTPPTSTTSTRARRRRALTSPTPRSRRPSTTSRRASSASPPRPARASGAQRSRLPAG